MGKAAVPRGRLLSPRSPGEGVPSGGWPGVTGQCESQGNGEKMRRGCDSLGGPNGRKSQCTRRGWVGGVGGPGNRRPSLRGARAGPCSPQGGLWPLPGDKAPPRERPVDGVLSIPLSVAPAAPGPVPRTLYQAPPPPDASRGADEAAWGTLFLPWYLLSQTGDTGLIGEQLCWGRGLPGSPAAHGAIRWANFTFPNTGVLACDCRRGTGGPNSSGRGRDQTSKKPQDVACAGRTWASGSG